MKAIDLDKIAKKLGAKRKRKVISDSGYFGALQLAANIKNKKKRS